MEQEEHIKYYINLGASITGHETTPQAIRINPLKTHDSTLLNTLSNQGVKLEKIPFLDNGHQVLSTPFSLGASIEYLLGYYSLQETASQLPAQILSPTEFDRVLDMTAAPGGKTTQMAAYMMNRGILTATDINRMRLYALENHLERTGVHNTVVYNLDALNLPEVPRYTKILLDAPCSGNYVTDGNWFSKRTKAHIINNAQIQRRLMEKALTLLEEGGVLLYSTCSLEPEENELNIQWMLENHDVELQDIDAPGSPGLTDLPGVTEPLRRCKRLWPNTVGSQGFFMAKVVKL